MINNIYCSNLKDSVSVKRSCNIHVMTNVKYWMRVDYNDLKVCFSGGGIYTVYNDLLPIYYIVYIVYRTRGRMNNGLKQDGKFQKIHGKPRKF